MPDAQTPYARYSRVTTRRGSLRPLNCPLEPELMVAEFSGELPPDVAQAVREHIAICETCGARAVALRTPYNLLTSLGAEPVPYVPDLRENVRRKAARQERWLEPLRRLGSVSRYSVLMVVVGVILVGLTLYLVRGALLSLGVLTTGRTSNSLTHVMAAAPSGALLVETGKVISVGDGAHGQSWQVAETLVTDQRNGQALRSLPGVNGSLTIGSASTLPVAIVTHGQVVYQLTSSQNGGKQALVAINSATGAIQYIRPLTLPTDAQATAMAISPDGASIYIGLGGANGKLLSVRVQVVSAATGKATAELKPATPPSVQLPAPTSSLPASAFPSQTPVADLSHMTFSAAAQGALVVSPDGQSLFDALYASDKTGVRYLVIRRIIPQSGETQSALALPGPFHSEQMVVSPTPNTPQLYIVSGSPNAIVYVIDISAAQPVLQGDIALGGPTTTNGAGLADTLSVSPTVDGQRLYVAEDATSSDNVVSAHIRWLVDTQGMGVLAGDSEVSAVGALLANSSTSPSARVFALVNGDVQVGAPDFSAKWSPWMHANDGTPLLRLIASEP